MSQEAFVNIHLSLSFNSRYENPMKTPSDNPEFAKVTEVMHGITEVPELELQTFTAWILPAI
jgi:hypothetical protein